MKLVCFSDTHGQHKQVVLPEGDVLVFAGDFTARQDWEIYLFLKWFNEQPYKYKLLVPGNHDWVCQLYESLVKENVEKYNNMYYLNNSGVEIEGIKFWGTATQPPFNSWAFNFPRATRKKHFSLIPDNTDVLITHCPPFGILDNFSGDSLGCQELRARVDNLPNLKAHIFGHIHEGGKVEQTYNIGSITYINCSLLTDNYVLKYQPVMIEVKGG